MDHVKSLSLLGVTLLFACGASAQTPPAGDQVGAARIDAIYPAIEKLYIDLHRNPELAFHERRTAATHRLIVRHKDRPGVLAHVFHVLRSRSINVQETENIVFEGAEAAIARINLDGAPDGDLLTRMRTGSPDILDLHVVPLPTYN